ncbi:hypothetical protein Vretimale_1432 [Volvox reticuliferus]|uniref:Uncharacterized protein n=1 Tax=Volvox reticuliferus TaxID=1737510 RepID=A0A8J4D967_9CHLO|nr:hypothetical protein Vretifemale_10828 [Volvox reticuliferus]GIL95396.1 hypothetical protein Vretimale_1432 [Volvox reticuliferus]
MLNLTRSSQPLKESGGCCQRLLPFDATSDDGRVSHAATHAATRSTRSTSTSAATFPVLSHQATPPAPLALPRDVPPVAAPLPACDMAAVGGTPAGAMTSCPPPARPSPLHLAVMAPLRTPTWVGIRQGAAALAAAAEGERQLVWPHFRYLQVPRTPVLLELFKFQLFSVEEVPPGAVQWRRCFWTPTHGLAVWPPGPNPDELLDMDQQLIRVLRTRWQPVGILFVRFPLASRTEF